VQGECKGILGQYTVLSSGHQGYIPYVWLARSRAPGLWRPGRLGMLSPHISTRAGRHMKKGLSCIHTRRPASKCSDNQSPVCMRSTHGMSLGGAVRTTKHAHNDYVYSAIFRGLCKQRKLEQACDFLYELVDCGVAPSAVCYNILIDAACKQGPNKLTY
jgi:pentatricopeptide repeat protein